MSEWLAAVAADPPVGIDVWTDPATGQLMLGNDFGTGVGVLVWILAVVLGLATSYLVLP